MNDVCSRLYLVRHGQVVNFSEGTYNCHKDVDITELGVRQMEAVAKMLRDKNLTGVYCSDLIRTKKGAEIIAAEHGLRPEAHFTLRELNIDRLAAQGVVDRDRVFIAGPSIGGMMTLRMACEAPDLIAGAVVAIAALPEGLDCPGAPGAPALPMLFLHGTADRIAPPEGGRIGGDSVFVRDRGRVGAIADTVALFAARNGCDGFAETALPDRDPADASRALRRDYRGCAAPLVHYVVEGGGHTWPGSRPFPLGAALLGATNRDFSATAAIEAFLIGLAGD